MRAVGRLTARESMSGESADTREREREMFEIKNKKRTRG